MSLEVIFKWLTKDFIFIFIEKIILTRKEKNQLFSISEWKITKTNVGNEMEIFIRLTKYNTHQWRGEGNPLLMVTP